MRWIIGSLIFIVLTLAGAAWVDRPSPLVIEIPGLDAAEDLSISRIRQHLEEFTETPSRMSGSVGVQNAYQYIMDELGDLGVAEHDIETQSFKVAVPRVDISEVLLENADETATIPIHPLWPNLARTSQTPPEGITGHIVDVGRGFDDELDGKPVQGSIVVMDSNSGVEWLSIQEYGGKAILFRANPISTGFQARKKALTVPANSPRFYVEQEHLATLDRFLENPDSTATVRCVMDWESVPAHNIFARISQGNPPPNAQVFDVAPVVFHVYYDSISMVPTLAQGAEQAVSVSTLLELIRYIRRLDELPPRPIYALFTGGHGQSLSGMTQFTRRLIDGLESGWSPEQQTTLLAQMGRPGIMIGLDLSSRSDRMGLFSVGRYRSQHEHQLRPKFSELGLRMDQFVRRFMTNYDEVERFNPHTPTPLVDCINQTLGRGWWTYFPYQAPFASEIPTMAGIPGVTLSTINDDRRYVDTPEDTLERLNFDLLNRQIAYESGERVGLARLAIAFTYWRGPFVGQRLENKMSRIQGRVVWLDQQMDYTPNRPLVGAVVNLKTYRGDRNLMGTRGVGMTISDEEGRFEFDGLIDMTANAQFASVEVEAFGVATDRFLENNPNAKGEYMRVLEKGEQEVDDVILDGRIVFANDWARPAEFPAATSMTKQTENLNIVTFPCRPITLFGLTEPRGFISLTSLQLLDVSTESPPYQWGTSYIDSAWGDPEENCMTVWADPTLRVRLTMGFGMQEKRLVLINNTPEDPIGTGYVLSEIETIPSWVLQGARNMWTINEYRINRFEAHGITNPRVQSLHDEAEFYLSRAELALENNEFSVYRMASERGWALESAVYNELLAMANNMIRGVLFYLLLLLPFSYCLERLVFASGTITGRMWGMLGIFATSFAILALIHPAFRFTFTPLLVLLAFVILALAATVSILILSKFDGMLLERKQASTGTHEDSVAVSNVAIKAVDLGIANIRRRPQRAFLTAMTIVLVTFTLLSFTSVVPEVGISRLRHPDGEPVYVGLMTRDPGWQPLPNPLYDSMRRHFMSEIDNHGNVMVGRAWYFSDYAGNLSRIDLTPVPKDGDAKMTGRFNAFTAVSLVGMEPREPIITDVEQTLVAGRWFEHPDELGIILPEHAVDILGLGRDDLGALIRIFGQEIPLIGIYDVDLFDELRDIDGEPLTPVNFAEQSLLDARSPTDDFETIKEYVHWGSSQVAIVPFKFARDIGASIRSIAVKTGEDISPAEEAESYARRSNLTLLASNGYDVTLYASINRSRLTGAGQIFIPIVLGFIMVLGTMLGSVYERRNEIFVYNSVGLSPGHVASLFLAESSVYAIIGAAMGYLLGQVISKLLLLTGMLSGLSLNYSAGTTVLVTLMTMAIVLVSTVYPARQAFLSAIPDKRGRLDDEEEGATEALDSGDKISIYLPFVAVSQSVFAMQAYMAEYLDSVQGVSVGRLAVDDLRAGVETMKGQPSPSLYFRAWLAPFDLGISHDAELRIVYREDRGVYQYHLTAIRHSGDEQNWRRLTPWFILGLRKQLLMWRILSTNEQEKYADKAEKLFGQRSI